MEQDDTLASRANAAFKAKNYHQAIELYTQAIGSSTNSMDDEERAKLLVNRSNAHSQLGRHIESREDAQLALKIVPFHAKALHRLAAAEEALNHHKAAATALCLGAAHHPSLFGFFCEKARKLGAWKLPPPLLQPHQ